MKETLGYYYTRASDGEHRIEVLWDSADADGFLWDVHEQCRGSVLRVPDPGDGSLGRPVASRDEAIEAWRRIKAAVEDDADDRRIEVLVDDYIDAGYDTVAAVKQAHADVESERRQRGREPLR